MDNDYRDEVLNGNENDPADSVTSFWCSISSGGLTEDVLVPSAHVLAALPNPWFFPRHVYVVASMNSVDRAAIPLDSALGRRFERIELVPSLLTLAKHLHVNWAELPEIALATRDESSNSWEELGPGETSILILDRLNGFLAVDLGQEFELGHGLLWGIYHENEAEFWRKLVETWEDVIIPQLEDRYAGRHEQLTMLLKVDDPPSSGPYAYQVRTLIGGTPLPALRSAMQPANLRFYPEEVQRRTLRWLTRQLSGSGHRL